MRLPRNQLQMIYGGELILLSVVLIYFEYQAVFKPLPEESYRDGYIAYTKLIYMSTWSIYALLLLAGVVTLLKSKISYLFLSIFALTALLEIYVNEHFYIVKTLQEWPTQVLLSVSVASILIVAVNLFKLKRIGFVSVSLSACLAVILVYLPNALITLRF